MITDFYSKLKWQCSYRCVITWSVKKRQNYKFPHHFMKSILFKISYTLLPSFLTTIIRSNIFVPLILNNFPINRTNPCTDFDNRKHSIRKICSSLFEIWLISASFCSPWIFYKVCRNYHKNYEKRSMQKILLECHWRWNQLINWIGWLFQP